MTSNQMERRTFLALLSAVGLSAADTDNKTGVLLLAHGGRLSSWNDEVNRIAAVVNKSYPTEVAFGMATKANIQAATDRLSARSVSRIVAVPLFISSYSSVITSTEWLLGLRAEMPPDYKMFAKMSHGHGEHAGHHGSPTTEGPLTPLELKVPVTMTTAINRHAIAADILADRARAISKDPAKEVVILVAHGPNPEDDNLKWLADLSALTELLKPRTSYARIEYLTVRDDASEEVRAKAKAELRGFVEKAVSEGKRALVVPVLLSYGGIELGIKKRLEGLEYTMATQGLLPDPRLADWVIESVRTATAK